MPPRDILQAVAALEPLDHVSLLDGPHQHSDKSTWIIKIRLRPNSLQEHPHIPTETEWYVHLNDTYPWGSIQIFPATENSITATFPHQHINLEGDRETPWRTGDICVGRYGQNLGRTGAAAEPRDPEERLLWYVQRALEWLTAASNNDLQQAGEQYEVPDFNQRFSPDHTVAFNETGASFDTWTEKYGTWGTVELHELSAPSNVFLTHTFHEPDDEIVYQPEWGDYSTRHKERTFLGLWYLLDDPPLEPPWEAPETWKELAYILSETGIDLYDFIADTRPIMEDQPVNIFLIGFPIPETIGEPPVVVHWQAVEIDEFTDPTDVPGSFRRTKRGWKRTLRVDKGEKDIQWLDSENWAHEQLSRRGSLPDTITGANILLIGAGALGSTLAECLVRTGCHQLTVMDGDRVEIGNMARHTLTLQDVGENKATALAERLQSLSPHTQVTGIPQSFPPDTTSSEIESAEIVIDCTASDAVLQSLQNFEWPNPVLFASASMGRRANRLFWFTAYSYTLPHHRFRTAYEPWGQQEQVEWVDGEDAVPERVGCWHPASVMRMDRIAMWAGAITRLLSHNENPDLGASKFVVLETNDDDGLPGISRARPPFQDTETWASSDSDLEVEIPSKCLNRVRNLCIEAGDVETGGILVGTYESASKARVISATDPPRDSVQGPTIFHRGTEHVDEWLREARDSLGIRYLGEWHSHPSDSAAASRPDQIEMNTIASNEDYHCPDPILLVVGENPRQDFSANAYVFHRDDDHEKLRHLTPELAGEASQQEGDDAD